MSCIHASDVAQSKGLGAEGTQHECYLCYRWTLEKKDAFGWRLLLPRWRQRTPVLVESLPPSPSGAQ